MDPGHGWATAQTIRDHVHPGCIARDNEELFARMVLNIFVTNGDDHLRNHAFSYDAQLQGLRLSPLYDVVPRPSVGAQGKLAILDNAMSELRPLCRTGPSHWP